MTVAEAKSEIQTLTDYYFRNSRACSCMDSFTIQEAETKIQSMIAHMMEGSAIVYGCFDNSKLLGYLWAYEMKFREEQRIYISEAYIEQSVRRQGFGSSLFEAIECEAKERGIPALYLHAEADNKEAIQLYERKGFRSERIQFRKALYE